MLLHLLTRDPARRLGGGKNDGEEIRRHPWFRGMDWNVALGRGLKPPKPVVRRVAAAGIMSSACFFNGKRETNAIEDWTFVADSVK